MKNIFAINLILLISLISTVKAQTFKIDKSSVFDENIGVPVLVMKDGTTVFYEYNERSGKVTLTLFDKNRIILFKRKAITFTKSKDAYHAYPKSWCERDAKIEFLGFCNKNYYRVRIDPKTLTVEEEMMIDCFPNDKINTVLALQFNEANEAICTDEKGDGTYKSRMSCTTPFQYDRVDPATGNFLQLYSSRILLNKDQLEKRSSFDDIQTYGFKVFDQQCKEVMNVPFDRVNNKYNNVSVICTYFKNNCIYFLNVYKIMKDRSSYDSNGGTMYLTKYDINQKKFSHKELRAISDWHDFDKTIICTSSDDKNFLIQFKRVTGSNYTSQAHIIYYDVTYMPFNQQSLETEKEYKLSANKLNTFIKTNTEQVDTYMDGSIDKFKIDKNGNLFCSRVKNMDFNIYGGDHLNVTKNPEMIGISVIDKTGTEKNVWAFPYNNLGSSGKAEQVPANFNYTIAMGKTNCYVLMNDLAENKNITISQKPQTAKVVDDCDAFIVELKPNGDIQKYFLLGESADKNSNQYGDFANAYFDEKSNTIILRGFEGGGFKKTKAVWVKLD